MGFLNNVSTTARRSPGFTLLLGLFVYGLTLVLLIPVLMYGLGAVFQLGMVEVQQITGGMLEGDPFRGWVFRAIQAGNQILTWGLTGWVMASLMQPARRELQLNSPYFPWQLLAAPVLILLSLPVVQALQIDAESLRLPEQLAGMEQWMEQQEKVFGQALIDVLAVDSVPVLLGNLLVFALIPAICEEIFFRGFLQQQLRRMMPDGAAIVLQALIFSFIHFQFYGFFARAFLGALLGYMVFRSGSLWVGIIGHFVFNGSSVLFAFLAAREGMPLGGAEEMDITFPTSAWISAIVLMGLGIWAFEKYSRTSPTSSETDLHE